MASEQLPQIQIVAGVCAADCRRKSKTFFKENKGEGGELLTPQKVMFGLFVLGFASANTPSPLKQHSQARLTARVSTFTLRQKWRLFAFSVGGLTLS